MMITRFTWTGLYSTVRGHEFPMTFPLKAKDQYSIQVQQPAEPDLWKPAKIHCTPFSKIMNYHAAKRLPCPDAVEHGWWNSDWLLIGLFYARKNPVICSKKLDQFLNSFLMNIETVILSNGEELMAIICNVIDVMDYFLSSTFTDWTEINDEWKCW